MENNNAPLFLETSNLVHNTYGISKKDLKDILFSNVKKDAENLFKANESRLKKEISDSFDNFLEDYFKDVIEEKIYPDASGKALVYSKDDPKDFNHYLSSIIRNEIANMLKDQISVDVNSPFLKEQD